MTQFEFVSHERYPEDKYIKEVVYISLEGKYRVGYVYKTMQNGGGFWDVMGAGVSVRGKKEYLKGVKYADSFLQEDIKEFLQKRKWESGRSTSRSEVAENGDLPF